MCRNCDAHMAIEPTVQQASALHTSHVGVHAALPALEFRFGAPGMKATKRKKPAEEVDMAASEHPHLGVLPVRPTLQFVLYQALQPLTTGAVGWRLRH
mmetsp:Transcript_59097/g.122232  ORF Transcript_59097/g.122232 Transcript_59097/m.122232 type:complete len:98 (+) Transcript_59097:240-533(+)